MCYQQFLILQIIAHLLADFTLQSQENSEDKVKNGFESEFLLRHVIIVFTLSWILSFQPLFAIGSLLIALIHWLFDGYKKTAINFRHIAKYIFLIDQIGHLLFILIITGIFSYYFKLQTILIPNVSTRTVIIFLAFIFCTKPANIFIIEILKMFDIPVTFKDKSELPNAGKLIGITERWLVLAFIIVNQFEAVGFLLAAKSILRYKEDKPLKTEYVLAGTMLSFAIPIAFGILFGLIK